MTAATKTITNTKKGYNINHFYLSLMILWRALQGTIMTFDSGGRTTLFLTLIVFFLNLRNKNFREIAFGAPCIIWLLWVIFSATNVLIQGYHVTEIPYSFFVIQRLFAPYVVLVIAAFEYARNRNLFLKVMLYSFLLYSIIGFYFMDNYYVAQQEGRDANNSLGNLLAINAVFIIFFAALLNNFKELNQKKLYLFIVFSFFIIIASATRKAVGAASIIYISLVLSQIKLNLTNLIKLGVIIFVISFTFNFVMENTFLGERFVEEAEKEIYTGNNPFLKLVGDRAMNYIEGYEIFLDNPLFGIGVKNYTHYTHSTHVLHTEYMVQMCEHGLVGLVLFILFYSTIIYQQLKVKAVNSKFKSSKFIMLGAIAAILFMGITAWIYDFAFYYAVIGTVVGNIYYSKKVTQ